MAGPRLGSALVAAVIVCAAFAASPASAYVVLVPDAANNSHTVASFDTTTNMPGPSVMAGLSLLGAAIGPDALFGYVVAPGSDDLTAIDLSGSSPVAETPVDLTGSPPPANTRSPQNIAISPDGRKAYIADQGNNEVLDVDLTGATPRVVSTIAVGAEPVGIAFSPDGTRAYVADFSAGSVTPITVATDTPGTPITGVGTHPTQIAITPDGSRAYVTDNGSDTVYPIALPAGTVGSPITVGSGPLGIAITPDGATAYVADFGPASNGSGTGTTVTPIDLATNTAGSAITVGGGPWAVAVTPDGKTVYATNSNDGTVTPIDTTTDIAGSPIALAVAGRSIAITPDQAPVANFTVTSAPAGAATSFDASSSTVRFGTIVKYVWSFGDGATATTTAPSTSHVYASAGSYTASVTETDSAGTSTTGEVYTGQTASSLGGPSAQTSKSVTIPTAGAGSPAVTLSSSHLDFGAVDIHTPSASQTVRITNTGNAPLDISGSQITGPSAGDFKLSADTCSGQTVAAGASCTADITFTPPGAGAADAQVAFSDNASGSPHVVFLTGTGTSTGTVTGTVEDGTRTGQPPLGGAAVTLCRITLDQCVGAFTDAHGHYSFSGVSPGSHLVTINPPSNSTLSQGTRLADVVVGQTVDAATLLEKDQPLPPGVTITSQAGTLAGGHGILYWDGPFEITLPPLRALPVHGQPNTDVSRTIFVTLKTAGTGQAVIGSALSEFVSYDAAGNLKTGLVSNAALPGTISSGFDFVIGGIAAPAGRATLVDARVLAAATAVTAQAAGLQRQVHGTLTLAIDPLQSSGPSTSPPTTTTTASQRRSPPQAQATDQCDGPKANFDAALTQLREAEAALGRAPSVGQSIIALADLGVLYNAYVDLARYYCPPFPPAGADLYVDPSGFVVTSAGIPLEHAKVVLERANAAKGPFTQPPNGNAVMAPNNRRNPDFTDLNGHFGWDVYPGFYRVRASRPGCHGTALSRARKVPPPVTDLRLVLSCPGLHRAVAQTRILSVRQRGPDTVVVVREQPSGRSRSRRGLIGVVTLSISGRQRGFEFIAPRSGRVTIVIAGLLRHRTRLTARYGGNARFAPSSASTRR